MRAFILSQFSYCPLVWMFCDRHLDNKINHIHKKALSIAYKDIVSDFDALLTRDNSVSVHKRNLQLLMTEIYKTKSNITPSFMTEIFIEKNPPYHLRNRSLLQMPKARTVRFGIDREYFISWDVNCSMDSQMTLNSHWIFLSLKTYKGVEGRWMQLPIMQDFRSTGWVLELILFYLYSKLACKYVSYVYIDIVYCQTH